MALPLLSAGKEILKSALKSLAAEALKDFLKGLLTGNKPPAGTPPVANPPPFTGGQCAGINYSLLYRIPPNPAVGFLRQVRAPIRQLTVSKNNLNQWIIICQGTRADGTAGDVTIDLANEGGVNRPPVPFVERQDGLPDNCGNPPSTGANPETVPVKVPSAWAGGLDGTSPPPIVQLKAPSLPPVGIPNPDGGIPEPPENPDDPANKEDAYDIKTRLYNLKKDLEDFRKDMECLRKKLCASEGYSYVHLCDMEGTGTVSIDKEGWLVDSIQIKVMEVPPALSKLFAENPIYYSLGRVSFMYLDHLLEPERIQHTAYAMVPPIEGCTAISWLMEVGVKAKLSVILAKRE